jgi:hypothetical protein
VNFNNHVNSIKEATQKGETLRKGDFRNPGVFPQSQDAPTDGIEVVNSRPDYGKLIFSLKEIELLNDRQFKILKAQGSMAFWKGSKDLVITIVRLQILFMNGRN